MKDRIQNAVQQVVNYLYSDNQQLNLQQKFAQALLDNDLEEAQKIFEEDKGQTIKINSVILGPDHRVLVPLEFALEGGEDVKQWIVEKGKYNPFHIALVQGKILEELEEILEEHPEYNEIDGNGNPPLNFAVRVGNKEVCNWFFTDSRFAGQIDMRNLDGDTVMLMVGLFTPDIEITAKILELRPDLLNSRDFDGNPAVIVAALANQAKGIENLVDFKAKLQVINYANETGFMYAGLNGQDAALKMLSHLNCTRDDYNIPPEELKAALQYAQFNSQGETPAADTLRGWIYSPDICATTPTGLNKEEIAGIIGGSSLLACVAIALVGKCLSRGRHRSVDNDDVKQSLFSKKKESYGTPSRSPSKARPKQLQNIAGVEQERGGCITM